MVVVDLDQTAADEAAERLGPNAMGMACDVTDEGALRAAVAATVERYGRLDVVVANAGIASRAATVNAMSGEAAERVLDVNLNGVWRTVNAALPEIIRNKGHVVVDRLGLRVRQRRRHRALRHGQGRRRAAGPRAARGAGPARRRRQRGLLRLHRHRDGAHAASTRTRWPTRVWKNTPKVLHKRLQPSQAGKGIVDGIEKRAPRIIRPHRWIVFSVLRGILNPLLDTAMVRDPSTQELAAELDKRGDQEQPTTA